jgi:hypothetical protein
MSKIIRFEKSQWGLSATIVMFDTVAFYVGTTDHWGIGMNINLYDRSFTMEILNLYAGFEIYHKTINDN